MRGTGRNGDAGVDTYVKSSIAPRNNAIAKIIPSGKPKVKVRLSPDEENFRHRRRKPSDRNEAVDTYGDLRKSKVYLKYMLKLFHQAK